METTCCVPTLGFWVQSRTRNWGGEKEKSHYTMICYNVL